MRPVKTFVATMALAAVSLVTTPAIAQTSQSGTVIVIDSERVVAQSQAGRSMSTQLQAIATQMQGEIQPEQTAVQAEQQRLQTATRNQTPQQIQANTQLSQQIEAFNRRVETLRTRQMTLARDLEHTRGQALQTFNTQITPVLNELLTARGAAVVLDASVASRFTPNVDATADLIARLDQRVRTISVTRQAAPAQQQQQQGQQQRR